MAVIFVFILVSVLCGYVAGYPVTGMSEIISFLLCLFFNLSLFSL